MTLHLDEEEIGWCAVWATERNEGRTLWPNFQDLSALELRERWSDAVTQFAWQCPHLFVEVPIRFIEDPRQPPEHPVLLATAYVPALPLARRGAWWDLDVKIWVRCTRVIGQRPYRQIIEIGPKHLLWNSFDDGWGGATASRWIHSYARGANIVLAPPSDCSADLLARVYRAIELVAHSCVLSDRSK